jgi:hypothetical protein
MHPPNRHVKKKLKEDFELGKLGSKTFGRIPHGEGPMETVPFRDQPDIG